MKTTCHTKIPFKLYISPYKLEWKHVKRAPLTGCLLAFDFGSGSLGYSDFLPWQTFNEISLQDQLKNIKQARFSQRFLQAKQLAKIDSQARQNKKNLFFGLKVPDSHFLIEDILNFSQQAQKHLVEQNFKIIKLKLQTQNILKQVDQLKSLYKDLKLKTWRLDLQGKSSWDIWADKLSFMKNNIDYIEDPIICKNIKQKSTHLFAEDWTSSLTFKIKIFKATRDNFKKLTKDVTRFRWNRVIFTHSFDHPLGQAAAAYRAGFFYKIHSHFFETGAFKNLALCPLKYYQQDHALSPEYKPAAGFGFGFDSALKKEKWIRHI